MGGFDLGRYLVSIRMREMVSVGTRIWGGLPGEGWGWRANGQSLAPRG